MATKTETMVESTPFTTIKTSAVSKPRISTPVGEPAITELETGPNRGNPVSEQPVQDARVFDATPAVYSGYFTIMLVVLANFAQFISNCLTMGAGVKLSRLLGKDFGAGEANWSFAAFPLTNSTFVLISGRLGAIYGHQRFVLVGTAMLAVFSLANGFCNTYESFVAVRALTGIGGGLVMPNAVAVVTTLVPPGRVRNIVMGIFGASLPMGGWIGVLMSGIFIEHVRWQWMFFFMAILAAVLFVFLLYFHIKEIPVDKDGQIDYVGAVSGFGALLLFNFAWNQAPSVGWSHPSAIVPLAVSVPMFLFFVVWETKWTADPIMPLHIFRTPTVASLIAVILLSYMSFGISQWYMIAWLELVRGWSIIHFAIGWIPFFIGSTSAILLAAWLLPRVPAQWMMALGVASVMGANLLLATMPKQQSYWAQVFPATILGSICPDFVYVAAQLIASNSVGRREQGIAGSLVGTLNLYGNVLGLGFAGTIETQLAHSDNGKNDQVYSYRAALYFGAALAFLGLLLDFAFVRVPKDNREGWQSEEDEISPQGQATSVEENC